jgi:hypothetical protein
MHIVHRISATMQTGGDGGILHGTRALAQSLAVSGEPETPSALVLDHLRGEDRAVGSGTVAQENGVEP